MIPFYLCTAHGGTITTIDDPAVVNDGCAANGSGGTAFTANLRPGPLRPGVVTFGKLRRLVQRIVHDGDVTVSVMPIRDGQEAAAIERTLEAGDAAQVVIPMNETGREFMIDITLSAWTAECGVSDAEMYLIPRGG